MRYLYRDWNLPFGRARGPILSDTEAPRQFDDNVPFFVLVGDPDRPAVVCQVAQRGHVIATYWLDEQNRRELSYVFAVPQDAPTWPEDLLLLEQSHLREYDDDDPRAKHSAIESYCFHPDGKVYGSRGPVVGEREEMQTQLPVEQLQTERVPAFGRWEPFLRRER